MDINDLKSLWVECPFCQAKPFQRCEEPYPEEGFSCYRRYMPFICWVRGGHDYKEEKSAGFLRCSWTATCSRCGDKEERGLGHIPISIDIRRIDLEKEMAILARVRARYPVLGDKTFVWNGIEK